MASQEPRRLSAIVLNYRTPALVLRCLEALLPQLDPARDAALVVDNGSGDGSAAELGRALARRGWPARLVAAERNGGFASGMNLGIRVAPARSYLLLNSDAVPRPGAVLALRERLAREPGVGLVGPRLEAEDGAPQLSAFRFPSPLSELLEAARTGLLARHQVPVWPESRAEQGGDIDWLSFAAVLIRARLLEEVGLLDDGFFMYYEDVELCRRARRAGWRLALEPQARVAHVGGASSRGRGASERRARWRAASRRRYFLGEGPGRLLAANLGRTLGSGLSWLRDVLGPRPPALEALSLRQTWRPD
ncbi:MAG: glycosyltransferase family 2 protein [Planctomycetota bacterium]